MIRVALVDDQAMVRAGLARILSPTDGFEVVAEFGDGLEAVEEVPAARPDVTLMDIRMPKLDGIASTAQLRELPDPAPILMLTTFGEDAMLWGAIEAGAAGFVLKDSSAEDLITAVRAVAGGGAWFDPAVAPRVLDRYRRVVAPAARDVGRLELLTESRARRPAPDGARRDQRGNRLEPARRRGDGEDPRRPHFLEAGRPRPRGGDRVRLRPRRGQPRRHGVAPRRVARGRSRSDQGRRRVGPLGRCAIRKRDLAWRPPMRDRLIPKDDQAVLEAARSGDPDAFEQLVAEHRPSLHAHSYRMLGSRHDADDAIQEALLRAWRAIPRFEGRSSVRTWLYRIATNASLDLIARRRRRAALLGSESADNPAAGVTELPLTDDTRPEPHLDDQHTPQDRYERRETVELAFIAALRHLPSRPRAALILRDVLGFTARESAEVLSTSPTAVNSALQRARAALEKGNPEPSLQGMRAEIAGPRPADTVEGFVDALERDDLEAIIESLRAEVRRRARTRDDASATRM